MQLRPDLVITAIGSAILITALVLAEGTTNPVTLARWFTATAILAALAGSFAKPFGG